MSRRGSAAGTGSQGQGGVMPQQAPATASRPFSRQASAIGGRPIGSAVAGGRLGSAMHRSAVPGTASRLQGN